VLLTHWGQRGYNEPGHDDDVINAAALPDWLAGPAEHVRREVLRAADATDRAAAAAERQPVERTPAGKLVRDPAQHVVERVVLHDQHHHVADLAHRRGPGREVGEGQAVSALNGCPWAC